MQGEATKDEVAAKAMEVMAVQMVTADWTLRAASTVAGGWARAAMAAIEAG